MRYSFALLLSAFLAIGSTRLVAQNILNNGGFENGMMCFTEQVFSGTGQEYVGDYRFSLSTDAHSGTHSMQLACSGTDCYLGAVSSNWISVPANQSYLISAYAKCPAGALGLLYVSGNVPGIPLADVQQHLICDGNWNKNQLSFQTGVSGGYLNFVFYSYGKSWLLVDDVVLTLGDGSAPAHTVQYPGVRNVSISGQRVNVDGNPFLSLGFFHVGYNDLAQAAATGANTINGYYRYNNADCYNTGQTSYLDLVYKLGMTFIPDSTSTARLGDSSVFKQVMQTFAPHLANIGWLMADEPDQAFVPWYYIPPATFQAEAATARAWTSLPLIADFQRAAWGAISDTAPYNGSADIWMAETYGADFNRINHAVNTFNSIQPRPIWLAEDDIDSSQIVPKAYWSVIAGATGIHYFYWDAFKSHPPLLAAATQAFTELKGLQAAIFGQKMDTFVTAPAGIASMSRFDPTTGISYILAANSSGQAVQGNFLVQGLAAGQIVTVLYENRTIAASAGRFSDSFAGVSRHAYAIQSANTSLTATIGTKTGLAAARNWQLQVSNSGIGAAAAARITNVAFTQTGGKACIPSTAPGSFPVALGSISPSQSATGNLAINFTGCDNTSKFTVRIGLAANSGQTSSTVVSNNERM